ncbi:MAG: hypothetical protein IPG06_17175 [Haliea sp.]|nr:hypothetical protein [Haliea sp.]
MTTAVKNDYVIEEKINALTDWVITMPTKKFYVQGSSAQPPFSNRWNGTTACEPVAITQWDREEAVTTPDPEGPEFSPQPEIPKSPDLNICSEVSVISFGEESALNANADIRYGFNPGTSQVGYCWILRRRAEWRPAG